MTICQNVETPTMHEPVGQEADDEGADQRAADGAAPAGQRRPADDDGGDRVELERLAGCGAADVELGGDDQARHRRAEPGDHVDAHR